MDAVTYEYLRVCKSFPFLIMKRKKKIRNYVHYYGCVLSNECADEARRLIGHIAECQMDIPNILSPMAMDLNAFKYEATLAQSPACRTLGVSSAMKTNKI